MRWELDQQNVENAQLKACCVRLDSDYKKVREDFRQMNNRFLSDVQLDKFLGHGAWGDVYKGTCKLQVAIKQLRNNTPERFVYFKHEMEVLSICHHRNIVTLLGVKDDPNCPCIFMELMAGSLRQFIEVKNGQLKEKNITCLSLDIARGLRYLHSRSLIHSDIKTDNIFLKVEGSSFIAKVGDLGTTVPHSANLAPNRGTLEYAAPEAGTTDQQSTKVGRKFSPAS